MNVRVAVGAALFLVALVGVGSFVISPGDAEPEPVEFDQTISMGLTTEERQQLGGERLVLRVQVVYSQYPYVVGYRGVGLAADAVDDPLVRQQFGYPQSVHVEVMPDDVRIDDDGYLLGTETHQWIPADDAYFVVDTDAKIPSGLTPVAFDDEATATEFATAQDGRVVEWDERDAFEFTRTDGEAARDRVDSQDATANETVERAFELLDRPEAIVVGDDEPTLQQALDAADDDTAVVLPEGTYDGPVTINSSVTLLGENATIVGDDNGTVVTIEADDVAVSGISITGVGESTRDDSVDIDEWDAHTVEAYGYADSGVTVADADRVLVHDTQIETPAAGITLRNSNESVVDGVFVDGSDTWRDGFMGVVAMRSPAVIQESTFTGGRDGVYTHRAEAVTIRDNRFIEGRFGPHLMYTSDALVSGNCAVGQEMAGLVIMTDPSGIAFTDNVVVDSGQGILTSGKDVYIGDNVVVDSGQGISTNARNSLYTDNTLVGNTVGLRASSIVPTSVVVRNDVVDNDEHVRMGSGPLRVWSDGGEGNYWSGAEGLDREFSPTDPVDSRLHTTAAARTLSNAPAVEGLRTLRGSVPGMRAGSVVDAHPRSTPVNESRVEYARSLADGTAETDEWGCPA